MITITPNQVTPEFASMFNLSAPTGIRALAVLAGGNAGKIFTDDPAHPRWGLVWEADDGTLYRGGEVDRDVLAEAIAQLRHEGVVALGFRELGITTQEAYQGHGFATMTCAYLIKLCEESVSQTYWDCARLNRGSVALARKLGFQNERSYKLLAWFRPKQ